MTGSPEWGIKSVTRASKPAEHRKEKNEQKREYITDRKKEQ